MPFTVHRSRTSNSGTGTFPGLLLLLTIMSVVGQGLPHIVAPLIIVFSINVGGVILAEASLSFLGFGLPVNVPS